MQEAAMPDADLVFVAAHPRVKDGRKDVVFEARMLETGKAAGIAFSSIERLVEALGRAQPWVAMPLGRFRELMGAAGIADVALDPKVPRDAMRWQKEDVDEFVARGRV
jgi:hypothetical protein